MHNSVLQFTALELLGLCAVLIFIFAVLKKILWRIFGIDTVLSEVNSKTKSAEVRLGRVAETLSPLMTDFPVDVSKPGTSTVFIGQPIDFIHFDPENGITIIEVKSGESKVTAKQRAIRDLIKDGKVFWAEYRIK